MTGTLPNGQSISDSFLISIIALECSIITQSNPVYLVYRLGEPQVSKIID